MHLHLEGSITRGDAALLMRRGGVPRGFPPLETLYTHSSFGEFLKHFGALSGLLRRPADPAWLMGRLLGRLRRQGVIYAEIRVSPSVWERHGLQPEEAFRMLVRSVEGAEPEWRLIVDAVRQWDSSTIERDLEFCQRYRGGPVVALGLGGDECASPAARFTSLAAECRSKGITVIPHTGEALGPEEVESALDVFDPPRIGHGIGAARSPETMNRLHRTGVHLEVCPTSNYMTGVVKKGATHPAVDLWRALVPMSIGTDDPALFGTTLNRELKWARCALSLDRAGESELQLSAARASLLPSAAKAQLLKRFGA